MKNKNIIPHRRIPSINDHTVDDDASSSSSSSSPSPSPFCRPSIYASATLVRWSPARRLLLLALCAAVGLVQLWLLQRHLPLLGPQLSSTPSAALRWHRTELGRRPNATSAPDERTTGQKSSLWPTPLPSSPLTSQQTSSLSQRLPDCLIIGARKGGTRALLDALALHPSVRVARHEVHFFDRAELYRLGSHWYRAQMPPASAAEVTIEKTPAYFTNAAVPARVHALNPRVKLILIVRDPVRRTVSDFTQIRQNKLERHKPALDFERASFVRLANGSWQLNAKFKPIRNSLYDQHLARWLRHFPLAQLLVLDGDKFIRDPLSQLRLAERFLGLSAAIRRDQLVFNAQKGFFCLRAESNATAHCLGQSKGRKQVHMSSAFRAKLAAHFAPHNRRFFAQLNRHFPEWNG